VSAEKDPEKLIGRKLGAYKLVRLIGRGGMGAVFEARDESLERNVAVKVILPEHVDAPRITGRFLREAKLLSQLSHPNAVSMFAFGEEAGILYMVLELVAGRNLASLIASDAPFPLERAVGIVTQTLGALGAAHALGIIHRDLKPDNLMVARIPGDKTEHVKVLDFGLGKQLGQEDRFVQTLPSSAIGTPAYMAPEQITEGESVDPRADLYAVATILYEMLTGENPFDSFTTHDLMRKKVFQDAPAVRLLRPDLPASVEEVVSRALARDRKGRYASARLFADALAEAAAAATPSASRAPSPARTRRRFLRASATQGALGVREEKKATGKLAGLELGRYRLERRMTTGRGGDVYEAVDRELDRPVLVKVHETGRDGPARLRAEARLLARLGAPHAPEVVDVGETQGMAFLVLLGFPGRLLSELVAETPNFPAHRAASCALQLLAALERLHALGNVHRDVHPENVLVTLREEGETFQLLGFELAADPALEGAPLAPFASPEQAAKGPLDARSDLYSVAALLWQLVRGTKNRPLPVLLGAVVERAVSARPEERFQDAQGLAAAIEAARATKSEDEEPARATTLVGRRLGRYRVESSLGKGSLGEVYRGLQLDLRRPVALRVLAPEVAAKREAVRELVRGARAVARLSHPSIAQVFEVGVVGSFVASELVPGRKLGELLAAGALPVPQACGIALRILGALAHAHAHGVVHGRLDPSSVVLAGRSETPRVLDFGLEPVRRVVRGGSQEAPQAADDVVATARLLHEMLTGKRPDSLPRSPRRERPEVSAELEALLLKALSPRDTERFADARSFGLALRAAAPT
jgi:serine/threonine protein kinase